MKDTKIQISLKGMVYVFIVSIVFFVILNIFVFVNVTTKRNDPSICTVQGG